jgi:branched-chain amino acid transport system substrate-binding protein
MRTFWSFRGLAVAIAAALVTSAGAANVTAGAASAPPAFKVMVSGDFTSPVFAAPEGLPAAKSVLQKVPGLEVVACDTKGDPTGAQACEQKAVDENVVAVLNSLGALAASHPLLTAHNIPIVGYAQETVPNAFSVASGIGNYAALGVGVAKAGCKRVATIYLEGSPGGEALPNIIKSGAELSGSKEVARAAAPNNAPDLSAPIARLMDANPQCIVLSLPPTMVAQAVTAIHQTGKKVLLAGVNAIFTPDVLKSLGPLANGVIIPAVQLDPNDKAPVVAKIKKAMAAVDKSAPFTSTAISTWASATVLATALKSIRGEVTPASTLAALNALRNVNLDGAIHPFSAIELTNPIVKRSFNHYAINYKVANGKFVRVGTFYDLKPVLEQLKF